jgi:ribosome-associated toxin RatA of RatAB toxin-antitoxin module
VVRWPGLRWLLLLALTLTAAAGMADPGAIQVEARREGDAVLVKASARLTADAARAWEVLTGYDRYAEFVPDLQSSRVISRNGNVAIVDQKGVAGFFLYHYPVEVQLEVTEQPYQRVTSRALSGNFKEMVGVYELLEQSDGLRFVYSGRLVPSFRLPPLIGIAAVRLAVEKQFRALVQEIQRPTPPARQQP